MRPYKVDKIWWKKEDRWFKVDHTEAKSLVSKAIAAGHKGYLEVQIFCNGMLNLGKAKRGYRYISPAQVVRFIEEV